MVAEKKSLIAAEQDRPDVARRRRNCTIARRFVDPGSLVFLDESGARATGVIHRHLFGWHGLLASREVLMGDPQGGEY